MKLKSISPPKHTHTFILQDCTPFGPELMAEGLVRSTAAFRSRLRKKAEIILGEPENQESYLRGQVQVSSPHGHVFRFDRSARVDLTHRIRNDSNGSSRKGGSWLVELDYACTGKATPRP